MKKYRNWRHRLVSLMAASDWCKLEGTDFFYRERSPLFTDNLTSAEMVQCKGLTHSHSNKIFIDFDPLVHRTVKDVCWTLIHELGHVGFKHLKKNPRSPEETERARAEWRQEAARLKAEIGQRPRGLTDVEEELQARTLANLSIDHWLPIAEHLYKESLK